MNCVIDIECNALVNPTQIWVIVCKDIGTGEFHIFRNVTTDEKACNDFISFGTVVNQFIGHNILEYDLPVLKALIGFEVPLGNVIDTLVCSRLCNFPRKGGHSLRSFGEEFGIDKHSFSDWSKYTQEMEDYCVRDVDITHKVYLKYLKYIENSKYSNAIKLEHKFQTIVNDLSNNGFKFNISKAQGLLTKVTEELRILDEEILKAFPPRLRMIREIHPKETKYGTLNRTDFRWLGDADLSEYNGGPFCRCGWVEFNPASHKQIIDVLQNAGWSPTDRTQTHIDTEREINRQKYLRNEKKTVDLKELTDKLEKLKVTGWKINETNLATLPPDAPSPARSLATRILYESRRRTLTEWLTLVQDDGRIHGRFNGIGAWTHRMASQKPNMQNIPNEFDTNGNVKLLGKELRECWQAPKNRLLVGCDAEGIQLRIFAHYIDDKEFTDALVHGRKSDKTDPHSLNARILGDVCRTRQAAKRFVYALLLGGGIPKLAEILEASEHETRRALDRLMERYQGFTRLKDEVMPADAKRGWFNGLDGRAVIIPGETTGERKHLCMSGYLQNGEAIVMKLATIRWLELIDEDKDEDDPGSLFSKRPSLFDPRGTGPITSGKIKFVNIIHDEWQTEAPNDMDVAIRVAELQSQSLAMVGEDLQLKCPLAGSYWNDDHHDYTIGTNWYQTH